MDKNQLKDNCNTFLDETMNLNDLPGLAIGVSIGNVSAGSTSRTDATGMTGAGRSDKEQDPDESDKEQDPDEHAEFIGVRGFRDYKTRMPLKEDDIFHCASVSKLFTSSAVMKLVEAGVLGLDARLCDILPDLNIADRRCEEIRLWNMLTHTSGLGDVSDYRWYDFETDKDSLRRYVYESEEVLQQPMLWDPQETRFRYSNIAYEILGQIVAEYSAHMPAAGTMPGTGVPAPDADCSAPDACCRLPKVGSSAPAVGTRLSYEDFVARYLLEPARMTDSTMKTFDRPGLPDFASNEHMAMPHEKKSDRSIGPVKYYPYTRQHAPSSTLTSNVRDLLRWGRAHLASARGAMSLLRPETYRTIWRPYATVPNNGEQMGLGWFMREQTVTAENGTACTYKLYGHEGTDDGFRASFWICPELDMVTLALSNLSGAPVKRINKKLFDRLIRTGALWHG